MSGEETKDKTLIRTNKRQQTYAAESFSANYFKSDFNKNRNNIDFLSNAFVFKRGNNQSNFFKKRLRTTDIHHE